MNCIQCKGIDIAEITPQDLFEEYGLFQDCSYFICQGCGQDCTNSVQVSRLIYRVETELKMILRDKQAIQNLTPEYFKGIDTNAEV